jgi:predicted RNA-binding Zn-ribbon protein involved in translation (DUF1610 family)
MQSVMVGDEFIRIAEHLWHATDGRWHDACRWCQRRRVTGGNGLSVTEDEAYSRAVRLADMRLNVEVTGDPCTRCGEVTRYSGEHRLGGAQYTCGTCGTTVTP